MSTLAGRTSFRMVRWLYEVFGTFGTLPSSSPSAATVRMGACGRDLRLGYRQAKSALLAPKLRLPGDDGGNVDGGNVWVFESTCKMSHIGP